ncbi:capsular exopolysaccharide family [Flavobacterium swingsii]|jgi:succinoglycan biosynthesis transport protein ExoP|uniref:non-specific protein-tyrosine kinase n=1 Tax=Flavobacterium swingsii TaxID=498292 RepID=A0A1I0Z548_9FLAO|nr:tyrosine-protein kinase [Flavobacterium swingsii]SFB20522.1 capsular exopolysaccharide family [Flavobacterium swingsii]
MLDTKDFSFFEAQNNFDFKAFFTKILGHWNWFLVSLIIAFTIAYQVNVRKEKIYGISTTIAYKEENNPFFTANTSLVFNWGGTSDQVQTLTTTIKSRSHNERVVKELNYYIEYLRQGKYNIQDAYGEVPFYVNINKNLPQLAGQLINIKFISPNEYEISINFEEPSVSLMNYTTEKSSNTNVQIGEFKKRYKIGEQVSLPFLHWKLELTDNPGYYEGSSHMVRFADFNGVVETYKNLEIKTDAKGGAIIDLDLQGTNKARMVDYLNGTISVLMNRQLEAKNQFATNTIRFIDSTLVAMEGQLKDTENELKDFSRDKNIFEVELGGEKFTDQITSLDVEKDLINRKIAYYNSLKSYLVNSVDYSKLPAPSVAGIDDPNIISNVSKLTSLSAERAEMSYAVKNDKKFKDFDIQMDALKRVLLENISSAKASIQYDLAVVNKKLGLAENTIKKLPGQQQELVKINRKYDLNKSVYNSFLEKRSEADIVRAANLSDIQVIDPAKDTGGGLLGPKTNVNYVLALFLGLLIPLMMVFGVTIIDNTIKNTEEITKLTKIPVLGVVGKKNTKSNLAVFEKPKSGLAESFRAVRSSLQFLYKKQQAGAKTLMLTSSISGEGKTFCSINIATVFALSEKKTVIVGLDLRKPKIFKDFHVENTIGAVNYLIGQKTLEEITQKTSIPFLDFISSGPVPPNPAELIMGESMKEMLDELKKKYDYIILDTPPVGLVSDALELTPYCDATLYIVRQNVTKKDMLTLVNNKHKRGELSNISIVFNGFENKAKYGYEYGYGYGYGTYADGYHEVEKPVNPIMDFVKKTFKK